MHAENASCVEGGVRGHQLLEYVIQNQHASQMQSQVHRVIANRTFTTHLVIDPKGEVSERSGLQRPPHLPPSTGRRQRWIRKYREVVKLKGCKQAAAERNKGSK